MKSKILGLRTTIYKVSDLKAAKEWYGAMFDTQPYFDEPFYVGFDIGGYELGLQPVASTDTDKTEGVVTYWGVEDIQAVFRQFTEAGATLHEEIKEVGGGILVASVKDPWGNIIGLIYNPHFKIA